MKKLFDLKTKKIDYKRICISIFRCVEFLLILICFSDLFIRFFNRTEANFNWSASGALAQWVSAFVAILIPIFLFRAQKKFDSNKREIGESNIDLLNEFKALTKRISEIESQKNLNSEEDESLQLKNEIYKYICIKMEATTKEVAENFDISIEQARKVLIELSRVDGKIKSPYIMDNEENEDCSWVKN